MEEVSAIKRPKLGTWSSDGGDVAMQQHQARLDLVDAAEALHLVSSELWAQVGVSDMRRDIEECLEAAEQHRCLATEVLSVKGGRVVSLRVRVSPQTGTLKCAVS